MSQSGFTPIQLYRSATPGAVPLAGNLAPGELAINTADQKLFFENASGTVVASVPFNTTGVLDVANGGTGASTLTSGYLLKGNGASAVSSSVLYENGGYLGIGTTGPAVLFDAQQTLNGSGGISYTNLSTGASSAASITAEAGGSYLTLNVTRATGVVQFRGVTATTLNQDFTTQIFRSTGGSEYMRITSAGNLGLGTIAPSAKLDVAAAAFTGGPLIGARYNTANFRMGIGIANANGFPFVGQNVNNSADDNGTFDLNGRASRLRMDSGTFQFETSSVSGTAGNAITWNNSAYLDASGNLGIGMTPNTWGTGYRAIDMGVNGGSIYANTNSSTAINIGSNVKGTGVFDLQYAVTGQGATQYTLFNGVHSWFSAASGTAGATLTFTERMRLDASGNVGIGTTAPNAQLAVIPGVNPATATGTLQTAIGEATNNAIYQMRMGYLLDGTYKGVINTLAGGNGTDLLLNPSGGAVGIGTSAGKAALTITRNSSIASVGLSASIVLSNRNTTLNGGIAGGIFIDTFRDVADPHYTGGVWFTRSSQVGNFSSSSDIVFGAANTIDVNALPAERMRISGFTGHVGIGTVGPGSRLQVEDASPARGIVETIRGTGGTGAQVHFSQDGVADWALGQPAGVNALAFFSGRNPVTDGTERMRIDSAGALRVNETTNGFTSSLRLSVTADPNEGAFLFKNSAGNGQWTGWVWNSATSGDNLFISFMTEAGGTGRGSIIYNRGAGLLAFNTTSDYRAKDILGPVTDTGATIDAIKVHNGKMKGATVARPMLVAHEAQEVVPYAVMGEKDALNKDGTAKYQQMDHQSLVPLLIAEVQSLRARVAQLEGNQP